MYLELRQSRSFLDLLISEYPRICLGWKGDILTV
jgi:hypothetical protein